MYTYSIASRQKINKKNRSYYYYCVHVAAAARTTSKREREREKTLAGGWLVGGWVYNRAPFVSLGNRHEKKTKKQKIRRINKARPVSVPERIKNQKKEQNSQL